MSDQSGTTGTGSEQTPENSAPPPRKRRSLMEWVDLAKRFSVSVTIVGAIVFTVPVLVKMITTKGIIIQDIGVPSALSDRGLTGQVISQRILDKLHEIKVVAASKKAEADITGSSVETQIPSIQLPVGGGISLAGAVHQIRQVLGYSDTNISGEVTTEVPGDDKSPAKFALRLRMAGHGVVYHSPTPSDKIEALIEEAAQEIMHRFDPINLGFYMYRKKDYKNAYRMTETAIANDSPGDDGWAFNMRGLIQASLRHYPEAVAQYREAIRREPKFVIAYHNLSQTLRLMGQLDEAAKVAAQAIEIAPKDRQGYANLALVMLDQGKAEAALAMMQKAVVAEPRDPQRHYDLGVVLSKMNRLDDAAAAFQKSAEIKPDFADAYAKLSTLLHSTGKYEQALELAQKAADVDPKSPVPWNLLGLYALDKKDNPHAVENFRKTVTLDGAFVEGYVNLGIALTAGKKYRDAQAALQKAIELDPKNVEALAHWADALEADGKHPDALTKVRQAIAIAPKQTSLYEHLGRLQETAGDIAGAIDTYRLAINLNPKMVAILNPQIQRLSQMSQKPPSEASSSSTTSAPAAAGQ